MNTSCGRCGDTVKCRLEAPYFDRKVRVRIYTYRSRNGLGISYVYILYVRKSERVNLPNVNQHKHVHLPSVNQRKHVHLPNVHLLGLV